MTSQPSEPASPHASEPPPPPPPLWRRRPVALLVVAGVLLVAAILFPLLVWMYASEGPRLWGFPFFYWYQLMWVFIAAILTYIAYLIVEGRERR